jgi:methionyl-tRNA formyltransferase
VKTVAESLNIPVYQPPRIKTEEQIAPISAWQPDMIVVAAYGHILRENLLALPAYGCVNVHASLLPRWRGAAPINAAILAGDAETGITIMKMDAGMDTGDMLTKASILIRDEETAGELFDRLAVLGAELLVKTLPAYLAGDIVPEPQDDSQATFAPMLNKADGELDFMEPASDLERQVRAYNPWPGTYFEWGGNAIKVHKAHAALIKRAQIGHRYVFEGFPAVNTSHGLLVLDVVQPPGKSRMSGRDYLNGARDWEND